MKKETENLVKNVANMTTEMSHLTVDKINETAPVIEVAELRMTAKEKAASEGVRYIEPKRKLQAFGKLPEKLKKEHERAWEYVKGIYENYVVSGEPIEFWYSEYPGDPDCLWEIPCNVPVYIPRLVAKHLEECQKYHSFSRLDNNVDPRPMTANEVKEMRWFYPSGTHYRGKFRAIGVFA